MNKVVQLWLVGLALVVAGCIGMDTDESEIVQSAGNLGSVCGPKWQLKRLRVNGEAVQVQDRERFTFLCNTAGNVMGKSGVNTYRGAMTVTDNGQLLWDTSSFASTKMAGPSQLMQQEQTYLRALAGTRQAFTKSGGGRLILRDPSGDIYIEYISVSH